MGLSLTLQGVEAAPIRVEEEYSGVRIRTAVTIAGARLPIQIDVGFGDVIKPEPIEIKYRALFDVPARFVRCSQEAQQ